VSRLYPTLILGIEQFGRTQVRQLTSDAASCHPALSHGLRGVVVETCPPAAVEELEPPLEEASLVSYSWFPDEASFRAAKVPVDPEATLPLDLKDGWLASYREGGRLLQDQVDGLLHVETEAALRSAGIEIPVMAGSKRVNVVLLVDLLDDRAWLLLPQLLRIVGSLIYAEERGAYLHVCAAFSEQEDREIYERSRTRLGWLQDRLRTLEPSFEAIRCYPLSDRLGDGSTVSGKDQLAVGSLLLLLLFLPFSGSSTPLESLIHPPLAEADAILAEPARTDSSIRPDKRVKKGASKEELAKTAPASPRFTAVGAAADYFPLAEIRRRLAFRLGFHVLGHSVCATELARKAETEAEIQTLPLFRRLKERSLLQAFSGGVPVELAWEEGGSLSGLVLDKAELAESIAKAPLDQWLELADNFDFFLHASRMPAWREAAERNRREQEKGITEGEEGLAASVDRVIQGHPQPLRAAETLLAAVEQAVGEEAHPFRGKALTEAAAGVLRGRQGLAAAVQSFPSPLSLALRMGVLLLLSIFSLFTLLGSSGVTAGLSLALAAGVCTEAGLYWSKRQNRLLQALDMLLQAVWAKHESALLCHLQEQLSIFDQTVKTLVEGDRAAVAAVREQATKLRTYYAGEMERFAPLESVFLHSLVCAEDLSVLYEQAGYPPKYDDLALALARSGFLDGWRTPDEKALRKALWAFVGARLVDFPIPRGLGRYVTPEALRERLGECCEWARKRMVRHRPLPGGLSPSQYLFGPGEPDWETPLRQAASEVGIDRRLPEVPFAVGVFELLDAVEPEVLAEREAVTKREGVSDAS